MKNLRRTVDHAAFTMVELMGAVTIALGLILMLYTVFDKVQSVFVVGQNRAVAMEEGRSAMDMIVADIMMLGRIGDVNGSVPNLNWQKTDQWKAGMDPKYLINNSIGLPVEPPFKEFVSVANPSQFQPSPPESVFGLFHHDCRFFTTEDNWKLVQYRFGPRTSYVTQIVGTPNKPFDLLGTPVGALWVYCSSGVLKGNVIGELVKHDNLKVMDNQSRWLVCQNQQCLKNYRSNQKACPHCNEPNQSTKAMDVPMAYSKLIDGVIHFRVRAVDPLDPAFPGKIFKAFKLDQNPFVGGVTPEFVEIELAILDKKLLKEVESGLEQSLSNKMPAVRRRERIKYINENLDRVYFFKQLIRVRNRGDRREAHES